MGTLVKATNLLDTLAVSAPIGVMELSRRPEMDKSGVSRLLTTLKFRNYVRVGEDGRYDLGLRLFELGQLLQDRLPFRKAIIPRGQAARPIRYTSRRRGLANTWLVRRLIFICRSLILAEFSSVVGLS